MPRVLTLGTFDLPHPGHVALFRECRGLTRGDGHVYVAVSDDAFVARWKHKTPIMTCAQRATVVGSIRYVDGVVINDGTDQPALIESVEPDIIAIGADWRQRDYHAQLGITPAWLNDRGIELVYVEHEHSLDVSTSLLRERLLGVVSIQLRPPGTGATA